MAADSSQLFAEAVEEYQTMYTNINAKISALGTVMQLFRDDARAGEGSSTRGPLASSPIVRQKLQENAGLQRAALQAYSQITDRTLKRIVRTWIDILAVNQDLRNTTSRAIDEGGGKIVDEIRRARGVQANLTLAVQYLDRQEQLEENTALGLNRTLEDNPVDDRLEKELQTSNIEESDEYNQTFHEDEQARLKRRRMG
jgi:hypothetical protein